MARRRDTQPNGTRVTLSQIAELAGVGASAVSNWRRRFDDFPAPVGTAPGGGAYFELEAMEAWLSAHDRLSGGRQNERLLFEAADILRGVSASNEMTEVLCAAIALAEACDRGLVGQTSDPAAVDQLISAVEGRDPSLADLFTPLTLIDKDRASRVFELVSGLDRQSRPTIFEWVLTRRTRFVETRTSEMLVNLLGELAFDGTATVFDPAAGEGGFLMAAAQALGGGASLSGEEINHGALRLARQRFFVHDIQADVKLGDSLAKDAFPNLRADVVLCDPPYGAKPVHHVSPADPRWLFGFGPRSADFLWLQHAIYHLAESGRGYVLLPAGSLFRRGREADLRAEFIRRGAIEAIIALPSGTAQHTSVPLALWIVQRPAVGRNPRDVLFVDATRDGSADSRPRLDSELMRRIVSTVRGWRQTRRVADEHRGFAATAPVLELLSLGSDLVPARWVHRESTLDVGAVADEFSASAKRVDDAWNVLAHLPHGFSPPRSGGPIPWIPVRDLLASDTATVIKGVNVRPDVDGQPTGTRVLRTRDIKDGTIQDDDPVYVNLDELRGRPALTTPGDIVVSPGGGKPRAVVDERGGHVLARPLEGLRLRTEWLDPHVAAAFLESPRNRRFATGTTTGWARIDVRELELPVLPIAEAIRLREMLDQIEQIEQSGRTLSESAQTLREAALDLAASPADEGVLG
jgi:N-6 DNA Methylase